MSGHDTLSGTSYHIIHPPSNLLIPKTSIAQQLSTPFTTQGVIIAGLEELN